MPPELDQPVSSVAPDAAISVLLCLFHQYATQARLDQPYSRLSRRIYQHLESLSQRDDLSDVLIRTFEELSDAWLPIVARQARHQG